MRHLSVREYVDKRKLAIKSIPSASNTADVLTKALAIDKFAKFRDELGVKDVDLGPCVRRRPGRGFACQPGTRMVSVLCVLVWQLAYLARGRTAYAMSGLVPRTT